MGRRVYLLTTIMKKLKINIDVKINLSPIIYVLLAIVLRYC